jgi:hypothetical protein
MRLSNFRQQLQHRLFRRHQRIARPAAIRQIPDDLQVPIRQERFRDYVFKSWSIRIIVYPLVILTSLSLRAIRRSQIRPVRRRRRRGRQLLGTVGPARWEDHNVEP